MYINNNNKQAINITNSNVKDIDFRKLQNNHGNISLYIPYIANISKGATPTPRIHLYK